MSALLVTDAGPSSSPMSTGGFCLQKRSCQLVVHRRHMLDLLGERAHALELAVGGSESELILRHRVRRGNELVLQD